MHYAEGLDPVYILLKTYYFVDHMMKVTVYKPYSGELEMHAKDNVCSHSENNKCNDQILCT